MEVGALGPCLYRCAAVPQSSLCLVLPCAWFITQATSAAPEESWRAQVADQAKGLPGFSRHSPGGPQLACSGSCAG